jgi:hypothetical protein
MVMARGAVVNELAVAVGVLGQVRHYGGGRLVRRDPGVQQLDEH